MRLVCPNCSAQYEVDTSLIPDEGRDVQCSNCGHTWFELPPPPAGFEDTLSASPQEESDDEAEDEAPSEAVRAVAAASEKSISDEEEEEAEEDEDIASAAFVPPAGDAPRARRPADAADVDLLREEAQRELSQRRAPPSEALETQTDMALDQIRRRETPSRALRARMASMRPDNDPDDDRQDARGDSDYQAPRKDLLPDIDEINSTLKPARKRRRGTTEAVASHRSGFRMGFFLMLLIAAGLIVAYAFAPAIASAIPGSETALVRYVDGANAARDWLDGLIQR
ncbi:thioredoxin [Silicimonas algicola]|uniref:Putative Zn finger-like uncharacterized protein n=1 Tax=Silicimonas algicola TaxID=1826607 RepID=A0A316FZL1_9RHOB|nr:zinc-ribbon domain-containing protein [Silicimonas algicola]AZQ69031.1 thioredoxin [Silicimonas algicola]PWK54081.1 putative Zn finger-like uncharacterized protein [Silicimonas algicola]